MAQERRNLRPGYTVIYPNRDKAASKTTKSIVVILLVASGILMLLVTFAGWSKLQGLKPINIMWALLYFVIAFYIARWNRGLLPIAAAFAILLLGLALIAGTGLAGTSWFDRNHTGFASPQTIFGSGGLSPSILGALTLILAPLQLLVIVFAMQGFSQGWNVEQEVPEDEAKRRGGERPSAPSGAEPATA
jgi:lysylphosphatidylglycerol synthetase-like protein (DUF2156 family)